MTPTPVCHNTHSRTGSFTTISLLDAEKPVDATVLTVLLLRVSFLVAWRPCSVYGLKYQLDFYGGLLERGASSLSTHGIAEGTGSVGSVMSNRRVMATSLS